MERGGTLHCPRGAARAGWHCGQALWTTLRNLGACPWGLIVRGASECPIADNTGFRSARLGEKARGSSDPGPLCYWAGLEMKAGHLDLGTPSQKGRNLGELLLWNRKSCWCPGAGGAAETLEPLENVKPRPELPEPSQKIPASCPVGDAGFKLKVIFRFLLVTGNLSVVPYCVTTQTLLLKVGCTLVLQMKVESWREQASEPWPVLTAALPQMSWVSWGCVLTTLSHRVLTSNTGPAPV